MANDTLLYDAHSTLTASDYAERTSFDAGIRIRGSKFIPYDCNYFTPEAARRLALYILELADEADPGGGTGNGACCCDECREDEAEYTQNRVEGREVTAAKRVSDFFDALADNNFGPEVTRAITVAATPTIVGDALYSPRYDESGY